MRKIVKLIMVVALFVSCLAISSVKADEPAQFGELKVFGPKSQLEYPKEGDTYTLNSKDFVLEDDGDIIYVSTYSMDRELLRSLFLDEVPESLKPFVQTTSVENLLFSLFQYDMMKNNRTYSTYARLMDKFRWEVVGALDENLEIKMNGENYTYTYYSDFLEVEVDKITFDNNQFVIPARPKDNMKYDGNYSVDAIKAILDAMEADMSVEVTACFENQDKYESAKATKGKLISGGHVRMILPPEIFPDINPGAGSWMRNAFINTYGEDAIIIDPNDNTKRYIEIKPAHGVTTLLAPEPVISTTNKYSMHSDGKAIFWLANDASKSLDIFYDLYDNLANSVKTNIDTQVSWTIEMCGGFENYNFTSQMETLLPSDSRQTTWSASSDTNSITLNSTKSGIYKVTVSLEGNSDYCYVVIPGDVTRNSRIQNNDASAISMYLSSVPKQWDIDITDDSFTIPLADMDGNKRIQPADAAAIRSFR